MIKIKLILHSEKIVRLISNTLVYFFLAKTLPVDFFGMFNHVTAVSLLMYSFTTFGFQTYLVREFIVEKHNSVDRIISVVVISRFAFSLLVCSITYLILSKTYSDLSYFLLFVYAMAFNVYEVYDFYYQSQEKPYIPAVVKLVYLVIFFILKIIVVLKFDYRWIIALYFIEAFFVYTHLHILLGVRIKKLISGFDVRYFFELLSKTWPLIPSSLALMLYTKIDQVMIGYFRGVAELATFSIAIKMVEATYFIAQVSMTVNTPKLIKKREINYEDYKLESKNTLFELFVLSLVCTVGILVISWPIVAFYLGEKYHGLFELIVLYAPVIIMVFFRVYLTRFLHIEGLIKHSLYIHIITALINVLFNIVLIPSYGNNGAAVAMLLSYVLGNVIFMSLYKEIRIRFFDLIK